MADDRTPRRTSSARTSRSTAAAKLDCYFNPTEYSIAKANTWEADKVNGKPSPNQKFTSGTPRKLELSLLFDQTFPPYKMSVGRRDRDAAGRDGGPRRRQAPARRPPRRRSSRSAGAR